MLLESPFLEVELESAATEFEPELEGEDSYARPKDWPKLDADAVLVASLKKLKTRAAHLLELALLAKPEDFEKKLVAALTGTPWSSEKGSVALQRVLARLGAQAFVLGVDVPEANRVQVGFVNHPSRLTDSPSPGGRIDFLHYACERLRQRSFKASTVAEHERQLLCAVALFAWFQRELGRDYSLVALEKSQLLGYRRLCVALAHKHHQALLEHWLDQARRSRSLAEQALAALQNALEQLVITQVPDDEARLLTFNLDSKVFHDYFTPKPASDFPYTYFSVKAKASTQKPFETGFSALLRRRADQLAYLRDLLRASGSDAPPSLFRTEAWQSFLLTRWGSNWKALSVPERLRCALRFVERYFQLFTLHVPHNLRESCGDPSYLTRSFPRAVTGGRIHDCAVYAARWLHMLGALIEPKRPAADIQGPRIWLVEMPVHVGVMIRLNPTPKQEFLISINNAEATLHDIDPTLKDELAAGKVMRRRVSRSADAVLAAPREGLAHQRKGAVG
ncbi:MAG: hypothetical protein QM756_34955 [Polyangiaceae bacterium]